MKLSRIIHFQEKFLDETELMKYPFIFNDEDKKFLLCLKNRNKITTTSEIIKLYELNVFLNDMLNEY